MGYSKESGTIIPSLPVEGDAKTGDSSFETELSLKHIVGRILAGGHAFCSDASERQFILFAGDPSDRWRLLDSDRVRCRIAKYAFDLGTPLTGSELRTVIDILKGVALEHELSGLLPQQLWHVAEEDLVLRGIVLLLQSQEPPWSGLVSELLVALRSVLGTNGKAVNSMPKLPNRLSRKLDELVPIFAQIGIRCDRRRSKLGAEITLERIALRIEGDGNSEASSPESSSLKSPALNNFDHHGDDDGCRYERAFADIPVLYKKGGDR